ncbi:MAG: hypothetical protein ACE5OZ_14440 [Candidatus Heimdallarchaeota archaeon]
MHNSHPLGEIIQKNGRSERKAPDVVQQLFIITPGGKPLLNKTYSSSKFDGVLFPAFISAICSFGKEAVGNGLDQMKFGNMLVSIKRGKEVIGIFVSHFCLTCANLGECFWVTSALSAIVDGFERQFSPLPKTPDLDLFNEFLGAIDGIIDHHSSLPRPVAGLCFLD